MSLKDKNKSAFTLIELLVVISIIAIITTITIVSFKSLKNKAKRTIVNAEIRDFTKAVLIARGNEGKTLMGITLSSCSGCPCRTVGDLRNIASSSICYQNWSNVLERIKNASGGMRFRWFTTGSMG